MAKIDYFDKKKVFFIIFPLGIYKVLLNDIIGRTGNVACGMP